jgi:hypothetical protein
MALRETALAPEDIVNRALARIGGGEIASLDTDGDLQRQANLIYFTEVEWALGLMPWVFARKTFKLSRLEHVPETGYRYAYALPADRLGYPIKNLSQVRRPDQTLRDFTIENVELHADAEGVWSVCKVMVEPTAWPPEFRKAMIVLMASALAVPVSHDLQLARALQVEAVGNDPSGNVGGLMGAAITKELALSPPEEAYSNDVLTSARYGGLSGGDWWR